ncbi:peptidoglycan-binding protein [Streptomyces sp. NPDC059851]|uniref:peptidoglycan-binding protein n=1 Tax=Streptomyces sp. NPDC059851 TaxID=3346971 RepID=UPI003666AA28
MSYHPEASGPAQPDPAFVPAQPDPAFVPAHPDPAGGPSQAAPPDWSGAGPWPEFGASVAPFDTPGSAYGDPGAAAAPAPSNGRSGRRRGPHGNPDGRPQDRGSRLPWVVGGLLLLGAAGALVLWPGGSDPEAEQSVRRPDLSIPVLPGSNHGAGDTSPTPSGQGATTPSTSPGPSASPSDKPSASPSASGPTLPGPGGTLRMGDRGPEVTALQQRLYEQGFTYVNVSGVYDGQTKRGVAQLQRDRDVQGDPTGVYGPATRASLGG